MAVLKIIVIFTLRNRAVVECVECGDQRIHCADCQMAEINNDLIYAVLPKNNNGKNREKLPPCFFKVWLFQRLALYFENCLKIA